MQGFCIYLVYYIVEQESEIRNMYKTIKRKAEIKRTKQEWIWPKASKSHSKKIGERCLEDIIILGERCLEDIIISCYVDGLIKGKDKEMVEKHLTECNNCIDLLLLHRKVREDETHEAQSTAVKKPEMSIV